MKIQLNYYISNNGDGSASVHFTRTLKEAEVYDEFSQENCDGFAESTAIQEEWEVDENGNLLYLLNKDGSPSKYGGLMDVKKILIETAESTHASEYMRKAAQEALLKLD